MLVMLMGLMASGIEAQERMQSSLYLTTLHPIKLETVALLPQGVFAMDAGLAFEFDRELDFGVTELEYDNFRLAPLGLRYGVTPYFEIGGMFKYSSNDDNDRFAPDDSGLEGISLFGKLELNKNASLRFGFNAAGDDDVFPYPSDEVDVFANLSMHRLLGKGLLYGEFGYTSQGGDLDFSHYFNYGIGYVFPASDMVSLNIELVGEEERLGVIDNTLDLVLGANFLVADNIRLTPFLTLGINDAGPDFSFGGFCEIRF